MKRKILIFCLVIGFFVFLTFNLKLIKALDPVPKPIVACKDTRSPEFNSLRPYQASPCEATFSDKALFCGDSLLLQDSITVKPSEGACTNNTTGTYTCDFSVPRTASVNISLENATLPIMGNTEDVINSQKPIEGTVEQTEGEFVDVFKVNNYLSWYLNGTINRAEYPPLDGSTDMDKIINYSGPIVKLLPQEITQQARVQTVKNAVNKTQHNQVVGCTYGLSVFGITQVGAIPGPCYSNGLTGLLSSTGLKKERRLNEWSGKYPPIRSNYKNYVDYKIALEKWRGKACAAIKLPSWVPLMGDKNVIFCADSPFNPNWIAALYPSIPMSSTEDVEGNAKVATTITSTDGTTITNVDVTNLTSPKLYLSHLAETSQLAALLQKTYLSKSANGAASGNSVSPQVDSSCKIVDTRSNKGDSLFATPIKGSINYTANFSCTFNGTVPNPHICRYCDNGLCKKSPYAYCIADDECSDTVTCPPAQNDSCTKIIPITLAITTETPLVNDIWNRLVAGTSSVFRRLAPQLGVGTSLGEVKDIPASTTVTYTGSLAQSSVGVDGQLNFPHVGGISEYFLKGIQTMLRPKGFGEPISFGGGEVPTACTSTFDINTLPAASEASCKLCSSGISASLQKIIESAAQIFGVPGSVILGTMYHEGAFSRGLDWSDANVTAWSACGANIPGCDRNATTAQIPFGWFPSYYYGDPLFWGASSKVDPARTKETSSPCNALDGIFATAAALKMWSGGLPTSVKYPQSMDPSQTYSQFPDYCYNWDLNNGTGAPASCSGWNANTVATSQVGYGGYCPEAGKHPIGAAFPTDNQFIQQTMSYFNQYTCR